MEYSKKIVNEYLGKILADRFSTEVAIENNEKMLAEITKERETLGKKIKAARENIEELEATKKGGIHDKELREQNKNLLVVLKDDKQKKEDRFMELEGRKSQINNNLKLYKDFLETADSSMEIAKSKVSI